MTTPAERLTEALADRYRIERELGAGLLRLNPSVGSGTRNGFDVLPGDSLFIVIATARNDQSRVVVTANFYEQLRALSPPKQASR